MSEKMWRFPDNNYTDEKGLDTSDMEIFKKDPIASLAREICQNSIDASYGEKPVKVEFSLFPLIEKKFRESMNWLNKLKSAMNTKKIRRKKDLH